MINSGQLLRGALGYVSYTSVYRPHSVKEHLRTEIFDLKAYKFYLYSAANFSIGRFIYKEDVLRNECILRSTSSAVNLLKTINVFDKIIDVIHIDKENDLVSIIRILVIEFKSKCIKVE